MIIIDSDTIGIDLSGTKVPRYPRSRSRSKGFFGITPPQMLLRRIVASLLDQKIACFLYY